ncbi:MAG TPA: long-chain fatty acid--CoA ligase, partial [Firmicutes bacterium]|nr:long-chain fatty acid--CoA ligase [Bacillota bacterium]
MDHLIQEYEEVIRRSWDRKALSDYQGKSITYGELGREMLLFHALFKQFNIKKGDKIALLGRNSIHWVYVYLSALSYGAVVVPILPDFHPEDIQHIVNHSDAILFFVSDSIYDRIDETSLKKLKAIFSLETFDILMSRISGGKKEIDHFSDSFREDYKSLSAGEFALPWKSIRADDCAAIVYTSGTSGLSKGVMIPYRSLAVNVRYSRENMPLEPGDNILSFLPLAHAYGCTIDLLFPLSRGCHITFLPMIPSPKILLKAFDGIKPRLVNMVPLIIEKIYRKKIQPAIGKGAVKILTSVPGMRELIYKKIKRSLYESFGNNFLEVIVGGAPLNPEVERFFKKIKFPLSVGYGMTECGPLISYASWDRHPHGSVGKAMDYCKVRVVSSQPDKVPGEILVKGDNVMLGYYRNKAATEEAIDKDGWLHTGDLALMDKEGYLYIKGRSKNMILGASGQNIYPEEVENKVNNLPFVLESLVMLRDGGLMALVYP